MFFVVNAIFLFPLYESVYTVASDRNNFIFSACLFGLPIIGGYITRENLKFYIHISDKTAILFDLGKFIADRKKLFKIKAITPLKCQTAVKVGIDNSFITFFASLIPLSKTVPQIINEYRPALKIKSDFTFCADNALFIFNKYCFVFNLFSLNAMLFNSLLKKVVKLFERKKSRG